MGSISSEIKDLLVKYHGDTKLAIKEEPEPAYFYALSDTRENVLEWFDFKPEASLLEVGSGCGALTGLYSRRVKNVTLFPYHGFVIHFGFVLGCFYLVSLFISIPTR